MSEEFTYEEITGNPKPIIEFEDAEKKILSGLKVLVTGAGGSIGSRVALSANCSGTPYQAQTACLIKPQFKACCEVRGALRTTASACFLLFSLRYGRRFIKLLYKMNK